MPSVASPRRAGPSYIPNGYQFQRQREGVDAAGFGRDPHQVALLYTRGWQYEDWVYPLSIYIVPLGAAALAATEQHPSRRVDIGIPGAVAMYHDGLWASGLGEDELHLGSVVLHWDRKAVHSITVHRGNHTYAVRGPKHRGVGFEELVKIAQSVRL